MIANQNTNDDNGDQTRTIFQSMHFREPIIIANPSFWHLLMYWCMVIAVARLQYYQSIMLP